MRGVALILALGAGCYSPHPQEGAPCTAESTCPLDLICENGTCMRSAASDAATDGPPDAMPDADLTCSCSGNNLSCAGGTTTCSISCSTTPNAHCTQVLPSNGISVDNVSGTNDITISALTTFNTDTGAITGGITRGAGNGVIAGIRYVQGGTVGAPIGVFAFHALTVTAGVSVQFTGSRAAAFIVATVATIHGEVDGAATCYGAATQCAGPGGGTGGTFAIAATGCGPGGIGTTDSATSADTGGGGGAGFGNGGAGGIETITSPASMFPGGTRGTACITSTLEPLVGGSGGGGGAPGGGTPTPGGGGGGAIQITALGSIVLDGEIDVGGGGGTTGSSDASDGNGGGGAGGGAGGSILLEAPIVTIQSALLIANGGGGGGGANGNTAGVDGQRSQDSTTPAAGGLNAGTSGQGGNGAAGSTSAADATTNADSNAGGGGGGIGRIYIRTASSPTLGGTISPAAGTGAIRTQ